MTPGEIHKIIRTINRLIGYCKHDQTCRILGAAPSLHERHCTCKLDETRDKARDLIRKLLEKLPKGEKMDNLVNEIKVGDFVTPYGSVGEPPDHSWKGDVLEIIAINFPFIIVINRTYRDLVLCLSLRRFQIMSLTQEYVKATLSKEEK